MNTNRMAADETLQLRLKAMHLPSFLENYVELAERGTAESWSHVRYLTELAALGRALVEHGHPVLFTSVASLVERLLDAKRNLRLARELKRLDNFECLALDDIGYVQHDRAEMEVLFALLAERYERKSVMITSNLVFSKWDQIFKDPMTTAAAIDRVVHHAVVLEFLGPSVRAEAAERRAALAKRDASASEHP